MEGDIVPKKNESLWKNVPISLFIGQTKSGKTVLIQNLLFKVLLDEFKMDDIFVYSGTIF